MDYLVSAQWLLAKLGAVQMVPSVKVDHFGQGLALAGPAWCVVRRAIISGRCQDDGYGDYWREVRRSGAD